ncbi:MAG TPA: alkaline phosphatase family protein [Candidatus Limnocylindrales bacterium]|nr:alkaline phosphatase family protein [Candidatus Limnocylindrales bacterium]
MENHTASQIVGRPGQAPFLDTLASTYGLATDYRAITHPSEPNYLALTSGGTQGVTDDDVHDLDAPSLFSQLGSRWRAWQQDYPVGEGCFTGAKASGPVDLVGLAGTYVRKHDPAISYRSVSGDRGQCALIQPLAGFDPAAAAFALITPNLENDMHDGTVAEGDAFLRAFVPRITGSAAFAGGGVLLITFDEGAGTDNHVATVMVRAGMPHGFRATAPADHYSLLRTTEDLLGLPCLGAACSRAPIPMG